MSDWERAKDLFAAAIELPLPARREFIQSQCAGNERLRHHIEALLATDEKAGRFLERPISLGGSQSRSPRETDAAPRQIGPYRIVQQLAAGGMGVVYLADQMEPVRRRVALKLIKRGMDSEQVVSRFETEKLALSLMDHPGIARVLDGGCAPDGRPYFVMDYVPGVPITDYCDRERLTTTQRVELFIHVCQAVQHAHQKGIIHRDLKPSNVLVMVQDDRPQPKVIDFGVARAVDARLLERSNVTEIGQLVGTPEYMSPEQAEMSPLNVDTRTDVYALGVLLYELLTGTLPFDRAALRSSGFAVMCRTIREQEPLRPSTRLGRLRGSASHPRITASTLGSDALSCASSAGSPDAAPTLARLAALRRTEPNALLRSLRGELDWIVMKALDKDRTRRFESAGALAHDLRRYLDQEPVSAGPPGTTYRIRKFVRRNRVPVAAAGVVALSLIIGLAAATAGWMQASADRNRALLAESLATNAREAEAAARQRAETQAAQARFAERLAREQAVFAFQRLEDLLPLLRSGMDLAAHAPPTLRNEYPKAVREDTIEFTSRLFPELFDPNMPQFESYRDAVRSTSRGQATPEQRGLALKWAALKQDAIQELVDTSRTHRFRSGPELSRRDARLWEAMLPAVDRLNICGHVLCVAAEARFEGGRDAEAIDCLAAARRIGVSLSYGATTISTVCEYSIRRTTYRRLVEVLVRRAESDEIAAEFDAFLLSDVPVPPPSVGALFEGLAVRQIISDIFVIDGSNITPRVNPRRVRELGLIFDTDTTDDRLAQADFEITMRGLGDYEAALRRSTDAPQEVRRAELARLTQAYADQPLLQGFSGALFRIVDFYHRTLLERDGCIAVSAVAHFRAANGRWPASLEEALAGRPAGLAIRPHFGASFVYSLREGRPRLYHPGEDGEDNGGREAADPAAIDAPPGTDVVFIP